MRLVCIIPAASSAEYLANYTTEQPQVLETLYLPKDIKWQPKAMASGSGVGAEMTFSGNPNTGTKISIINSKTGDGTVELEADGSSIILFKPLPIFYFCLFISLRIVVFSEMVMTCMGGTAHHTAH